MDQSQFKPFYKSATLWISAAIAGTGAATAKLLLVLTAVAAYLHSDDAAALLAVLPPATRAKLDTVLAVLGSIIALLGVVVGVLRSTRKNEPLTLTKASADNINSGGTAAPTQGGIGS